MRLYTPLDLRNVKDIHTRSAFRRLDQWLRDLAGNLSPTQEGSASQQITVIQEVLANPTPPVPIRFDDFNRFVSNTTDLSIDGFDGLTWRINIGAVNAIRDTRAAGDTTYPDTGVWVFDNSLAASTHISTAALAAATPLTIYPFLRSGTQFDFWVAQPSGTYTESAWGLSAVGASNIQDPAICVRFLLYRQPVLAFDAYFAAPPIGPTYFNLTSPTTDFIALQVRHSTGPIHRIYRLGKASEFMANTATKMAKTSLLFERNSAGTYDVTASGTNLATIKVSGVDAQGMIHAGVQQRGAGAFNGKFYIDAFQATRPLPT